MLSLLDVEEGRVLLVCGPPNMQSRNRSNGLLVDMMQVFLLFSNSLIYNKIRAAGESWG